MLRLGANNLLPQSVAGRDDKADFTCLYGSAISAPAFLQAFDLPDSQLVCGISGQKLRAVAEEVVNACQQDPEFADELIPALWISYALQCWYNEVT